MTVAATVSFCLIVTLFLIDVAFINFLASDVLKDSSHIQKVKGSPIFGSPDKLLRSIMEETYMLYFVRLK